MARDGDDRDSRLSVVVGGASGIGASVAERLRRGGDRVVVWDRRDPSEIRCDVTDAEEVAAAAAATLDRFGTPATVTVTSGIGHAGSLLGSHPDEWDLVMATNARGAWLVMRSLAAAMREAGRGSMVAVSSVSAVLADRGMGLYCASKAALEMVVRVAAREWAPNVRVNAVAPGVTDTPMLGPAPRDGDWLTGVARRTPLGRLGRPDDVAEAVAALHGASWVTGHVLTCDGGLTLHSPIDPPGGAAAP